jgi:hypothetical protein
MAHWFAVFGASFLYVMLRAFQQRNVSYDNYAWIVPTSYSMAIVDTLVMSWVAKTGWSTPFVFIFGTGSALGCIAAMQFHKRYVKR